MQKAKTRSQSRPYSRPAGAIVCVVVVAADAEVTMGDSIFVLRDVFCMTRAAVLIMAANCLNHSGTNTGRAGTRGTIVGRIAPRPTKSDHERLVHGSNGW